MYLTKALIIRKESLKEHDRLLEVLTPEFGRINLIARGTRKIASKLNPHLAFLNLLQLGFLEGPKNKVLVTAETLGYFVSLDPQRYLTAFEAVKWIDQLIWYNLPEPATFELVSGTLRELSQSQTDPSLVVLKFKAKLLEILGYLPELTKCVSCGTAKFTRKLFSFRQGGLLCPQCKSANDVLHVADSAFWLKLQKLFTLDDPTLSSFSRLELPISSRFLDKLINSFAQSRYNAVV